MQPISEVLRGQLQTRNKVSSDCSSPHLGNRQHLWSMIKPSAVKQGMAAFKQSRPLPPAKPAAQVSFLMTDRVSSREAATETRNRGRPHLLRQADQGPQRSTAAWTLMLWTGWRESQGGTRPSRIPRAGGRAASAPSSGAAGHWSARAGCLWVLVVRSSSPPG